MVGGWRLASFGCAVALVIALSLTVTSVAGQAPADFSKPKAATGKWTVPRTVDGQPDLQGVWANNSITPLERPAAFTGRTTMTDAELERFKGRAAELFAARQAGDLLGDLLIQEILEEPDRPATIRTLATTTHFGWQTASGQSHVPYCRSAGRSNTTPDGASRGEPSRRSGRR